MPPQDRRVVIPVFITVMTSAVIAAAAETWKQGPAPYLWGVTALCALSLVWLIGAPRWRQWRILKRGGALKIIGGYKAAAGRRIRYEDGTEDVDIQGKGTGSVSVLGTAVGTWSVPAPPTRWEQIKRRFRLGASR